MDPITLGIAAAWALLLSGVGAAAVGGAPRAKHLQHDKAQAQRQRQIDDLEARIYEGQLAGGLREPPKDVSGLEAEAERLKAERRKAHRWWYYGE